MKMLSSSFLSGPNLYHRESVVAVACDLSGMPELLDLIMTRTANGAVMPGRQNQMPEPLRPLESLWRQAAGAGKPLLEQALYVALALQSDLVVSPSLSGKILHVSGSKITVALRCDAEAVGMSAWQLAVMSGYFFLTGQRDSGQREKLAQELSAWYDSFRNIAKAHSLDQFTLAMVRAASKRDIPWLRLGFPHTFIQLGHGKYRQRLHETMIETTKSFPVRLAQDKSATNQYLRPLGFPVPQQRLVSTPDAAVKAASQIGYPVVMKPCHGSQGRGVSIGLETDRQVLEAFPAANQGGDSVVIESVVAGDDHRLLVVGGKLIAGALRLPAQVIGNGRSTVAELIELLNRNPHRGRGLEKLLVIIDLDREAIDALAQQKMSPASVPLDGQRVWLRRTANISRGGTALDVTDTMHPDNIRLAEDVAAAIGLDVTGIDFLSRDITRSWKEIGGGIIEVNGNPGLRPHWVSDGGKRDVVGPIIDLIFPPGAPSRVPTAAITGSIGKTTTCRMVAGILAASGKRVGFSTTQGMYLDGVPIRLGDCAGGSAARHLLMQPGLEAGVFEMARGGLIKGGMGVDRCDVGAVLNVLDNHLGLDGVQNREALARVKRIVAENAQELVVLNADDPLCLAMREHVRSRRLCLFSARPDHPEVEAHRAAGGCSVVIDGDGASACIVLTEGGGICGTLPVVKIPATLGGRAMAKAVNAAFAVAIAHGLGVPFHTTAEALSRFDSSYETNPGRQNFYRQLPFDVMIDWLDGPEAARELAAVSAQLTVTGKRLLLLTGVGNRPDDFIINTGKVLSAGFDRYFCTNHKDLRGRAPDEVPDLFRRGLMEGDVPEAHIRCIGDPHRALGEALGTAEAGDLLVVVNYAIEPTWRSITTYQYSRKKKTSQAR
ncbi:MAG: acetate--CoA ligase family protein [Alphaproteobacteria bacterium]|nr:acetate--CoA ligase family protein [Alphaproteobacteria bacterium]